MKLKKANKKRETNLWLCCLGIRNQDDKLDVNRQCDWDYKIVILLNFNPHKSLCPRLTFKLKKLFTVMTINNTKFN